MQESKVHYLDRKRYRYDLIFFGFQNRRNMSRRLTSLFFRWLGSNIKQAMHRFMCWLDNYQRFKVRGAGI